MTARILANKPDGPVQVPALVRALVRDLDKLDAVWRNELGGQLLVTRALDGTGAVSDEWRARPREAVRAIAEGLRVLHELPPADCPFVCEWAVDGEERVVRFRALCDAAP